MARVLITGAAGFLGSHLCERFIKEGYEVIGMDNLITGDLANIEHLFPLEQFHFHHHDVSNFVFVPGELDYILHFASPASPIDYLKMPIQTLKVGSLGTHNLLGLAKVKKARMLIASTSEVYGTALYVPIDEKHPKQPQSPYSASKIAADAIAMSFYHAFGLPVTIARPFNTYGPRQSARAVIPTAFFPCTPERICPAQMIGP